MMDIGDTYVVKVYEHLHAIPEKSLQEVRTSEFLAAELRKMNFEVKENIAGTGIVAELDSGTEGVVLGVRADMDALEFSLEGKTTYIHACGHDANMAMVLATAKRISEMGIQKGKVVFIFQPAEETGDGAVMICESGQIDHVEEMVGIHLRPCYEAQLGKATPALCHGASKMMEYKITGQASHGARQHLGINAVDASALAVMAVNAVRVDPRVPHSAKVTNIQTEGSAYNIIPETAFLKLDLRAQTNEVMEALTQRVEQAIMSSVQSIGAKAERVFVNTLPAAEYDDGLVEEVRQAIQDVLGDVLDPIVTPGGEDFHNFAQLKNIRTAYIGLGADLEPGLHKPEMTFNKKALIDGEAILTNFIKIKLG